MSSCFRSMIESPQLVRRTLHQPNVFNPKNRSLLELRQFFNEVDKIKQLSRTQKRQRLATPQRSFKIKGFSGGTARRASRPLPFITFKEISGGGKEKEKEVRSSSWIKERSKEGLKGEGIGGSELGLASGQIRDTISNYYKKYLSSPSPKLTLESNVKDNEVYLSVCRIAGMEVEPRMRRKSVDVSNRSKLYSRGEVEKSRVKEKGKEKEVSGYFGNYDTPWDDLNGMSKEF